MISSNRSQNCYSFGEEVSLPANGLITTESETWFTSPQAAEFLGISVQALMNKVSGGKVPFYKFGRRNRYKKSELVFLLSAGRRGPNYGS